MDRGRSLVLTCAVIFSCTSLASAQKHNSVTQASPQMLQSGVARQPSTGHGWGSAAGYFYSANGCTFPFLLLPPIYGGPTIWATPTGFGSSMPIAWFGPMPSNGAFQNYSSVAYRDQPGVAMPALLGNLPVTHWANDRDVERASRRNAARVAELVKVGDRLFRAASLKRAEDRYQEAARIDSGQALPYVRLAQVAVKRGQYAEAVNQLRQAQTADPEWAKNGAAHDVQNLFGEPAEFAAELAKLETNLQANPSDRDLWLVLGTELFLTGRTQRALDVFVRLTDREPDALLGSLIESCQLLLENH